MKDTVKQIHADILFEEMKHQLSEGRKAKFRVSGSSMWPFLCHGRDFVILEPVDPYQVQVGDIVLLQREDGDYLLHRITHMNDLRIETTGDSMPTRDGWFSKESVIGRANTIIRKGKEIQCKRIPWVWMMKLWATCFPIRKQMLKLLYGISRMKK